MLNFAEYAKMLTISESLLSEMMMGSNLGTKEIRSIDEKAANRMLIDALDEDYGDIRNPMKNFALAKKMAMGGWFDRHNLPHFTVNTTNTLLSGLKSGKLDVRTAVEFGKTHEVKTPVDDKKAIAAFLDETETMRVKVSSKARTLKKLMPIQKQIYFDKSIDIVSKFGIEALKAFLRRETSILISRDDYIIDGHHRWLAGMLVDPSMQVATIKINLPIMLLLPALFGFKAKGVI